jgi:hypothetical protein
VHSAGNGQCLCVSPKDDLGWLPLSQQGHPPGTPGPSLIEWVRALTDAIADGRIAPQPHMTPCRFVTDHEGHLLELVQVVLPAGLLLVIAERPPFAVAASGRG